MRRKQLILILTVFVLAAVMMGSASAVDSSGDFLNESDGADVPSVDNDSSSLPSTTNTEVVDPIIGVDVNYEYSDDKINPEITVKDENGEKINYNKTINPIFGYYELSFFYNATNGTIFNITVSAPGYITQTQQISVYADPNNPTDPNYYGNAIFNMNATAAYKLGREVT
ncbi:hypothetical protein MXE27_11770, partial [Methanobacterium alcaliphilum]|nr:hypothetical protein [Methanobacterium alcaliphilum]